MHPILSDKTRLIIYLIVWGILGIAAAVFIAAVNDRNVFLLLSFTLPMMLLYGEVNLSAWYLSRAFALDRTPVWKILAVVAISVFIVSLFWTIVCWAWMSVLEKIFEEPISPYPLKETFFVIIGAGKQLFFLSIALSYLVAAFQRSREAERNVFEAKLLAQTSELKALRMQIDPHFLFNSLNSISALTVSNPQLARTMTTTLADFFRKSLSYGAKEFISLQEELSILDHYLDIETIRFGKRLSVERRIEQETLNSLIPPLLLQPLMENAIKHGIANSIEGGTIVIISQKKNNRLFITIENPFEQETKPKKGAGLGLDIVKKRLKTIYSGDADIQFEKVNNIYRVMLFFPIDKIK